MRFPDSCVDVLRERAQAHGDKQAFTFLADDGGEERLSFAELEVRARATAARLQELGASGERVVLLFPPGLDYIVGFWGCLFAGAVAVPAYPPNRRHNLLRIAAIADDCQPRFILTTAAMAGQKARWVEAFPSLGLASCISIDTISAQESEGWIDPAATPRTIAFLQYTSGSTGTPKGVVITHGNLLHNGESMRQAFGLSEQSVVVSWLPLYHDMGLIGGILQPIHAGASAVLMSPLKFLVSPRAWLQAIHRFRATASGGPNFAYELCLTRIGAEDRAGLDLSCWTVAFNGSEPVRVDTMERFTAAFADCGFRPDAFYPCYGLAESTLFVAGGGRGRGPVIVSFDRDALERGEAVSGSGAPSAVRQLASCGHPWVGQDAAIVDPETLTVCPPGRIGEIWLTGPSVAAGYWNRAELTESTFGARVHGPRSADGPFLRTGDLGCVAAGELVVTGRLKDLIIVRGRNLHPQDLELTVQRSHPALRPGGGAAFSVEGETEERLTVVQEVERRVAIDADAVAAVIRQAVAEEYEVQLHDLVFIASGSLPKTSSGKVQRSETRRQWLSGALKIVGVSTLSEESLGGAEYVAPRNSAEAALANICAEVLGLERVGVHDNFFYLGGHSLLANQVLSRIRTTLEVELPMATFFENPTVAGIAARLADLRREGGPRPFPISRVPRGPLMESEMAEGRGALETDTGSKENGDGKQTVRG
jgi:acyl-CoA synthetase (AMP-forming)/AMP-acid ligase II